MNDYFLLIGINPQNSLTVTEEQIVQAHFRTFRHYQGRKNSSITQEQRAEAEKVIDYLRQAQRNRQLPLPANLKHLLPVLGVQEPIKSVKAPQPEDKKEETPIAEVSKLPVSQSNEPHPTQKFSLEVPPTEIIAPVAKPASLSENSPKNAEPEKKEQSKNDNSENIEDPNTTPVSVRRTTPIPNSNNQQGSNIANQSVPRTNPLILPDKSLRKINPLEEFDQPAPKLVEQKQQALDKVEVEVEEQVPPTDRLISPKLETPPPQKTLPDILRTVPIELHPSQEARQPAEELHLEPLFEEPEATPTEFQDFDEIVLEPEVVDEPVPAINIVPTTDKLEVSQRAKEELEKVTTVVRKSSTGQHFVLGSVINCPDCEWEILTDSDSYCSGCGKSITSISVAQELVIYIGDTGSYTKSFSITNTGLIPVEVGRFEVTDINATVQPASTTWLGKNESLTLSLRVLEESSYGKRSGKLRFYYHGKPMEISIQLKEPPTIRLGFLNVPNTTSIHDSFILRLPQNQKEINCQITTDSDKPLTINSISLSPASNVIDSSPLPKGAKSILQKAIKIKKNEHYNFSFETVETPDIVLTIHFDELGVRHFGLKLYQVPTANLIDHIDKFLIGENAIILGSDACYTTFSIRNEVETEGLGKGRAEKIEFHNLPSWLSISPSILPAIEPGQTVTFTLKVISSSFTEAKQEHVQVKISYYDPQLECSVTRPEPVSIPFEFVAPREYKNWIAIDFGTSNTCAAIIEGTSFRTLYIDAATSGSYESPTCVQFVNETEKLYECGLSAYGKRFSGSRAMKATAWAFKPQLARSTEPVTQTYLDIIQGQPHSKTVDQIIAIYAKYLLESVKLKSGIAPKKAVITFPVTFGKRQRERLAEAFQKAGLDEVITTISEPVALAIHYAYLHKGEIFSKPSTFAVFDFGGGTIDIAIFQIEPTHSDKKEPAFQLLDVAGMELGGEFLTFELAKLIYKKLVPANQRATFAFPKKLEDLTTSDSDIIRDNYSRIAELAENIKRRLYVDKEIFATEIQRSLFDGQNRQTFSAKLVQQEFEEILKAHLQHPVTLLQSMLSSLYKRGKLKEEKLDYLILGGNSSRLPLVTNMLSETLFAGNSRHILLDSENIKLGVMKGALLYCAAPEALPFPVEDVNQTLPCRVGLLGTGFTFDLLFERGLIANSKEATTSRKLRFSKGRESLRLYYYFGHEEQPAILNNQKMKEYEIKCPFLEPFTSSAPVESQTLFHLLPDGNGIEVTFQINEEKFQQIVPILGGS